MSKKVVILLTILVISFSYIFGVDKFINNKISALNSSISSSYLNLLVSIQSTVNKYFSQLAYIDQLKKSNDENQKYKTFYNIVKKELLDLKKIDLESFDETKFKFQRVKVLSYYKLNDHSKVILDKNIISNNIGALVTYDGYSAGIVLKKDEITIAYLNQNRKCNYSVYIGEKNAPGITSGMDENGLIKIKHIPLWKKVKVDDEIVTSSMDGIFPLGIKVGRVVSIEKNDNTQTILALPYVETLGKRDFYLFNNVQ